MAAVAVFIVLIAVGVVYGLENQGKGGASADVYKDLSLISRVNTDGSAIYIASEYDPEYFLTVSDTGEVTYKEEHWKGKVFGTPGAGSVQHVLLMDLVKNKLGLPFVKYDKSAKPSEDAVYYDDSITGSKAAIDNVDILDGGIAGVLAHNNILDSGLYRELATTNILFPGHTCCVMAGSQGYLDKHTDETVRFLAAYIKAVDYINAAKADHSSEEYAKLIEIATEKTHVSEDLVKKDIDSIVYKYCDRHGSPDLDTFKKDISHLAESLIDFGSIKKTMSELGFDSYSQFADAFVDNKYLSKALDYGSWTGKEKSVIRIAALESCTHQIALNVADSLGFFGEYGLEISITYLASGAEVAQNLLDGKSDLAFMGASPITIAAVNEGKIHAGEKDPAVNEVSSLAGSADADGSVRCPPSRYDADGSIAVPSEGPFTFKPENRGGTVFGTP